MSVSGLTIAEIASLLVERREEIVALGIRFVRDQETAREEEEHPERERQDRSETVEVHGVGAGFGIKLVIDVNFLANRTPAELRAYLKNRRIPHQARFAKEPRRVLKNREGSLVRRHRHCYSKVGMTATVLACLCVTTAAMLAQAGRGPIRVERLLDRPIITPELHPSIGPNIQGPSLIKVPAWLPGRLGNYYLYFADHKGRYIRLAYADQLLGPWRIHVPGSLQLAGSFLLTEPPTGPADELARLRSAPKPANLSHDVLTEATTPHIASPDVHVDEAERRIVMYYHGLNGLNEQVTRVATSADGLRFEARPEILGSVDAGRGIPSVAQPRTTGRTYFRTFDHAGYVYAMAMPGQFYRSKDALTGFVAGPRLFNPNMRHAALLKRGDTLFVFWTQVGDAPERILLSTIDLSADWTRWSESAAVEVLRPERTWEGADTPLVPSQRSTAYGRVNQLRDPAVFQEGARTFLLYAVAGESGIAIAEITFDR